MKKNITSSVVGGALAMVLAQQSAVAAVTDYIVTGSFYADALEVEAFDENIGDYVTIDAYVGGLPVDVFNSPSFTLTFSVDESIRGTVPLFSNVARFNGALSDVSLDIAGVNVLTSTETGTVSQFPGGNGFFSRWSWSSGVEGITLPGTDVFDSQTGEFITSVVPDFMDFALYDSTNTVFSGGFPLDLITASLGDFTGTNLSLFWAVDYDDEFGGEFGEGFDGDAFYQIFGNVESITAVSEVPVPAAAWLFLSAIGGLVVSKRRQSRS